MKEFQFTLTAEEAILVQEALCNYSVHVTNILNVNINEPNYKETYGYQKWSAIVDLESRVYEAAKLIEKL